MLVLEHQDGPIEYTLVNGGFALEDSRLYLSLEACAAEEGAFPDRYLFAVDGYPLPETRERFSVEIATNPNDEPPNVYVYTTFHASAVEAMVTVEAASDSEWSISLKVVSEDVRHHGDRARRNALVGDARLIRKSKRELWIPS